MRTFQTSFGPVPVWGELERFDKSRPLVLVVRGAFDEVDSMSRFHQHAPEVDVALVHLPGMHTPFFSDCTIGAFASAFDEVLLALARKRVVTIGLSTGALVTLAMRNAQGLIAVEPPLSPAKMWPLIPRLRTAARGHPQLTQWVEDLFGVTESGVVPLDYAPLLSACVPGVVLLGSEQLEPERPIERLPSLVGAADRKRLSKTPHLKSVIVPGAGHNIPAHAPSVLPWALRHVLNQMEASP